MKTFRRGSYLEICSCCRKVEATKGQRYCKRCRAEYWQSYKHRRKEKALAQSQAVPARV